MGYPPRAPYDRILATCGVARIPAAWLEQARPGAVVVANTGSLLARLVVGRHGSAQGLFLPETASFMCMRSPGSVQEMPLQEAVALVQAEGEDARTASVSQAVDDTTVVALIDLAMPDVMGFGLDKPTGSSRCLVDPVTRSWARADIDGTEATVHQSGARRLWSEVERLCTVWLSAGRPRHDELGLIVDPDGSHHLWAGEPGNPIMLLPDVPRPGAT